MTQSTKKAGRAKQSSVKPLVASTGAVGATALAKKWFQATVELAKQIAWCNKDSVRASKIGKTILNADRRQQAEFVLFVVDKLAKTSERFGKPVPGFDSNRANLHHCKSYPGVGLYIVRDLLRKTLPFTDAEIVQLAQRSADVGCASELTFPHLSGLIGLFEKHSKTNGGTSPQLGRQLERFARAIENCGRAAELRYARRLLILTTASTSHDGDQARSPHPSTAMSAQATCRPVRPEAAGHSAVLDQLKRNIGLTAVDAPEPQATNPGQWHFAPQSDSPLRKEHDLLTQLLTEAGRMRNIYEMRLGKLPTGDRIKSMSPAARGRVLLAACERVCSYDRAGTDTLANQWQNYYVATSLASELAQLNVTFDRAGLFDYLLFVATREDHERPPLGFISDLIGHVEREAVDAALSEGERYTLFLLRASLTTGPPLGVPDENCARLSRLIGDGKQGFLVPGEAWSDALNAELAGADARVREGWVALLAHLLKATTSRPTAKWLSTAAKLVDDIGGDRVRDSIVAWLRQVPSGRTRPCKCGKCDNIHEENANCLRGMLWILPTLGPDADIVRAIAAAAQSAYRKLPGVGPRAVKVGNAAVYALSQIAFPEAAGQLAMLKTRVKFGTAQKEIDKAFTVAAERAGLPRDEIEEMGVPAYGLEEVGRRRETFGDYAAELIVVDSSTVEIRWTRNDGKAIKSPPAAAKKEHAEEVKELSQAAKDIQAMLPAQRERIDSLFLAQKSWPFDKWRERYLDHPLIGAIARRLIWQFSDGKRRVDGMFLDGAIVDVNDRPIGWLSTEARVEMWHPIGRETADVVAWRSWLERHQVRQPFKQAHREIYVLTDAERTTRVYSNRFAAHVLRQHQFNALCAARGWKNKLRLAVDDEYPPATRSLAGWNLRAEYWVEGIGEAYGADTNDSGVFHRLSTDQVRFYELGATQVRAHAFGGGGYGAGREPPAEPLPLEQIPPLVFSEIMRDVDLFVGVASVANDPTWQDGGPDGRFRDYWSDYAFGGLGEAAKTRREVLAGLLPRLKIADRCTLTDKFLVVRGDLRTYKIHLGSSNILMEPNDQYLCIVPGRGAARAGADGAVFLPFEGDERLAVILSKALLLADDRTITDESIKRQIL